MPDPAHHPVSLPRIVRWGWVLALGLGVIATPAAANRACLPPGPRVALTFDDGPHPYRTAQILEALAAHDAHATFFVVGRQVRAFPQQAQAIWHAGHELALHSDTHVDFATVGPARHALELERSWTTVSEVVPEATVRWWRLPYGSWSSSAVEQGAHMGLSHMLWDIDTNDWRGPGPEQIVEAVLGRLRPNAVVLMHDTQPSTVQALPQLLLALKAQGYQAVALSEIEAPVCDIGPLLPGRTPIPIVEWVHAEWVVGQSSPPPL